MPARRPPDQPQEPLDIDLVRDGKWSPAGRAVCDPVHRFWHVALAAVHLAALEALGAQGVVVLVDPADRARVLRVIGIVFIIDGDGRWWAPWRCRRRPGCCGLRRRSAVGPVVATALAPMLSPALGAAVAHGQASCAALFDVPAGPGAVEVAAAEGLLPPPHHFASENG